jgi:hypothetical protein
MTRLKVLLAILAVGSLGMAFTACNDDGNGNNGAIDRTTEDNVDGTADDAGDTIEGAADDVGDAAESAADDVGDAVEGAADDVGDAVDGN